MARAVSGGWSFTERWFRALVWLGMVSLLCFTGCNGCTSEDPIAKKKREEEQAEAEKKKKAEKPKPDFEFSDIRVQPNEFTKDRAKINYVKRGHWAAATQQVKANNFDVQAEIKAVTTNLEGTPYDIEHTDYSLAFSRPAAFPKGQAKSVETLFFVPRESVKTQAVNLRNDLVNVQGGATPGVQSTSIMPLDEWQYLFLVLSSRPSAYNLLDQTQSFAPLHNDSDTTTVPIRHYQLLRPALEKTVPLPTNALTWSSIAVILWDDLDPTLFTPEQQQALVDWLHWGGQLLVNGPNSIGRLRDSFLEPYLPVESAEPVNLTQADFVVLNANWSLGKKGMQKNSSRDLKLASGSMAGLKLNTGSRGELQPLSGGLVAERAIGRGCLLLTAFPLNSKTVQNWPNFDGFLNGALLRRPARSFQETDFRKSVEWADAKFQPYKRDARLNSNLRYFSRDIGIDPKKESHPFSDLTIPNPLQIDSGLQTESMISTALEPGAEGEDRFGGWMAVPRGGVASWNDFSGAVNAARKHVIDAAGIRIPAADFVLKTLGVYIIVLVPLNWLLFRSIGRVEWAWFAAPVIALVGAVTVVRLAHLDIGFVRSRTEIAVVEMQAGYSRAHVSRFINLYTALATYYDLVFQDATALAQPLPEGVLNNRPFQAKSQVQLHRDTNLSLSGFKVESNSQGMVHVEQMLEMGGPLELLGDDMAGWKVRNGTSLELRETAILRRTEDGYFLAHGDSLTPGLVKPLKFTLLDHSQLIAEIAGHSKMLQPPEEGVRDDSGELRLGRFLALAVEKLNLRVGDARLIAWSPGEVPGIEYRPDSAQVNAASFVIAHLRRAPLDTPDRDSNVLADIVAENVQVITPEDLPGAKPEDQGNATGGKD